MRELDRFKHANHVVCVGFVPLLGAVTVWLVHRFYGLSLPLQKNYFKNFVYLSQAQSLADYGDVLYKVREELDDRTVPIYGLGAS